MRFNFPDQRDSNSSGTTDMAISFVENPITVPGCPLSLHKSQIELLPVIAAAGSSCREPIEI